MSVIFSAVEEGFTSALTALLFSLLAVIGYLLVIPIVDWAERTVFDSHAVAPSLTRERIAFAISAVTVVGSLVFVLFFSIDLLYHATRFVDGSTYSSVQFQLRIALLTGAAVAVSLRSVDTVATALFGGSHTSLRYVIAVAGANAVVLATLFVGIEYALAPGNYDDLRGFLTATGLAGRENLIPRPDTVLAFYAGTLAGTSVEMLSYALSKLEAEL
ncbi:hypothetical protein [Halosimplex halobium]|uniref:hypothetical protein n=1 Tax=Halosimplex halobium TaxID=3396618 RepID=UPI003F5522F2